MRLDRHDVLELGHRPERPVHAVLAVMHRVLAAQTFEIRVIDVVLEQSRIADVDLIERSAIRRPRLGRNGPVRSWLWPSKMRPGAGL